MKNKKWIIGAAVFFWTFLFGCVLVRAVEFFCGNILQEKIQFAVKAGIHPLEDLANIDSQIQNDKIAGRLQKGTEEFDPSGYYFITDNLPKGFEDFDYFELHLKYYFENSEHFLSGNNQTPLEGYFYTKRQFQFRRVVVSPTYFLFETETKNSIKYLFVGKFIDLNSPNKMGDFYDLKGILRKYKGNKMVSEAKIKFSYTIGC